MEMTEVNEAKISNTGTESHAESTIQYQIPPLGIVKPEVRELWENYRSIIEAKAQKYYPMPCTFQMVPLKVSMLDIDGVKTYFFKARVPNNKFVNVRVRLSAKKESLENHVAVESHASSNLDEEITKNF